MKTISLSILAVAVSVAACNKEKKIESQVEASADTKEGAAYHSNVTAQNPQPEAPAQGAPDPGVPPAANTEPDSAQGQPQFLVSTGLDPVVLKNGDKVEVGYADMARFLFFSGDPAKGVHGMPPDCSDVAVRGPLHVKSLDGQYCWVVFSPQMAKMAAGSSSEAVWAVGQNTVQFTVGVN